MIIKESSTYKEMIYNKITLVFPGEKEELFLKKYHADSIVQFRIAFLFLAILFAAFGYLDLQLVPPYSKIFLTIRFLIVLPLLSVVLLLSFTDLFRKVWQTLLLICFIVGGSGIAVMIMMLPENYFYYAGMMLVFSAGYFFIKLRFFFATIAGWTTLIIFNLGSVFYTDTTGLILMSFNFFFVAANLIGMFAAYYIEYYARRDFHQKLELDHHRAKLEDININLEKMVEERTKELRKINSEKDKFFSIISHDLMSPFNGFLGLTQLLADELPELTREEIQAIASTMKTSAENLFRLLENLLQWSRMKQGAIPFNPEMNKINPIVNESIIVLLEPANKKKIEIVNNISEDIEVFADRDILQSVFRNLTSNAIKFTPEGGVVVMSANLSEDIITISVTDTGIGMSRTLIDSLFRIDVQTNRPGTDGEPSTGLGLLLCKEFIEKHGGNLRIDSCEGKGSTFSFSLPVQHNALISNINTEM